MNISIGEENNRQWYHMDMRLVVNNSIIVLLQQKYGFVSTACPVRLIRSYASGSIALAPNHANTVMLSSTRLV